MAFSCCVIINVYVFRSLWDSVARSLIFCAMFCRSLFVLLSFFFWPLCCLSFFDLRILITPLVSSNSCIENRQFSTKSITFYTNNYIMCSFICRISPHDEHWSSYQRLVKLCSGQSIFQFLFRNI